MNKQDTAATAAQVDAIVICHARVAIHLGDIIADLFDGAPDEAFESIPALGEALGRLTSLLDDLEQGDHQYGSQRFVQYQSRMDRLRNTGDIVAADGQVLRLYREDGETNEAADARWRKFIGR